MQAMRDLLRGSLARSLDALAPLDRLAAAWPIVAGHAVSGRSSVTALEDRVATVTVADATWQSQLLAVRERLRSELSSVSRIPLTDILFVLPQTASAPVHRTAEMPARKSR